MVKALKPEYAVYKGEELLAIGTAEECSSKLNVSKEYIYWLTMPTAKRRLASRKHPEKCVTAVRIDDSEKEEL